MHLEHAYALPPLLLHASRYTKIQYHIHAYLGLARTIYIWCIYGIFGREITKYTVIYGADIRVWPTLLIAIKDGLYKHGLHITHLDGLNTFLR